MIRENAILQLLNYHPIVIAAKRVWSTPSTTQANRRRAKEMLRNWSECLKFQLQFLASNFVPGPSQVPAGAPMVSFFPPPGTFHLEATSTSSARAFLKGQQTATSNEPDGSNGAWAAAISQALVTAGPAPIPTPQAPASFAPQTLSTQSTPDDAPTSNLSAHSDHSNVTPTASPAPGSAFASIVEISNADPNSESGTLATPGLASDGAIVPIYEWDTLSASGINLLSADNNIQVSWSSPIS